MLVIVLLLLLAAAGVLVFAVSAGLVQWAWLSVLLCLIAGIVLLLVRRRDRAGVTVSADSRWSGETAGRTISTVEPEELSAGRVSGVRGADVDPPATDRSLGWEGVLAVEVDPATEPPEEGTDAADALLVAESAIDVFVIDERPRYHRDDCSWVGGRATVALSVRGAGELGFTPCGVCCPDRSIAEEERTK